jgi:hypothetical protein
MQTRISVLSALFITGGLFAPLAVAEPWSTSVDASLTLTENAYSDNWTGGESGTINWMFLSNSLAEKQLKPRVNNKNILKLQFGQNHIQNKATKQWSKPEKSNDLIDFESIFRFNLDAWVDPFVSGRLESRFLDSGDPEKNIYFNPVTLTESFGVAKVLVKEEGRDWTARLGAGFREHIAREVLDITDNSRSTETATDGGIEFVNDMRMPLAGGKIKLQSKLIVFQALFNSKADDLKGLANEDYWHAPDVNFENIFTANITKYLAVNLYTQFLYDKEIARAGRFKETLGLGVTWKYERFPKKAEK